MREVPKSVRTHIGIFGRANVGKSSFLNLVASQDVAIVSPHPGTTTDVVEKVMELRPVGPVVFLDTAGLDDDSLLSGDRIKRTAAAFGRADVFVVLTEEGRWGQYEERLREEARACGVPLVAVVNKADERPLSDGFRAELETVTPYVMACSCVDAAGREAVLNTFKELLVKCLPDESACPKTILSDLIPSGGLAVLVVPVDSGAPKGRLILPQVQVIRDVLDGGSAALTVRDSEYALTLAVLGKKPDIAVCDSQAVKRVAAETPPDMRLTTFSILFARFKGDIEEAARGAQVIGKLKSGDKVLIAEACTHHAGEDDIGRVKLPRWLREHTGLDLHIDICSGRDYPENLEQYALIIHCGACMLTRREMLSRLREAVNKNVPITNYGMAISYFHGVLDRVMEPFRG
jgi:[FeFe] hydrogenase H-cluster maturation GTPase HydF